jgi:hypothetical protein
MNSDFNNHPKKVLWITVNTILVMIRCMIYPIFEDFFKTKAKSLKGYTHNKVKFIVCAHISY